MYGILIFPLQSYCFFLIYTIAFFMLLSIKKTTIVVSFLFC